MYKAIIFDFDGTIIDTEKAWYAAFREAYREHGVELAIEQYSLCIGTDHAAFNPYEYLITELGLPLDRDEFKRSVHDKYEKLMAELTLRPGILECLQAARKAGLSVGLATSSSEAWISRYLEPLGIRDYFDCIRTSDHVARVKPDPELYIRAAEGLQVKPGEAVAVEDSPNGARAAIAAGMDCIVVPNEVTAPLAFPSGVYRIESLADIQLEQLLRQVAESQRAKTGNGGERVL